MNSITFSDKHPPCGYLGILGCNGYEKSESVVCLTANGDNNFLNEGIVEGSILFVDTGAIQNVTKTALMFFGTCLMRQSSMLTINQMKLNSKRTLKKRCFLIWLAYPN